MAVIGFRRFLVDSCGRLAAMNTFPGLRIRPEWDPDVTTAVCAYGALPHKTPPDVDCTCGLYAFASPIGECGCRAPSATLHGAIAAVRMWGEVVHCGRPALPSDARNLNLRHVMDEVSAPLGYRLRGRDEGYLLLGYRAQFARVVALVDFTGRVRPEYDVPRYATLNQLYAEWAADTPEHVSSGAGVAEGGRWCTSYGDIQAHANDVAANPEWLAVAERARRKAIAEMIRPNGAVASSGDSSRGVAQFLPYAPNPNLLTSPANAARTAAYLQYYGSRTYAFPPPDPKSG